MKHYATILAVILGVSASAQTLVTNYSTNWVGIPPDPVSNDNMFGAYKVTNAVVTIDTNSVEKKDWGKYDVTLGGDATTSVRSGKSTFEVDLSISTNPFRKLPNLWLGMEQSVGFEPSFSGATDASAYWSFGIYHDKVFLNPGWSCGEVYGGGPSYTRTGPIMELQWYAGDDVFIYTDVDYDALQSRGSGGIRYSFGIGMEF